MNYEEFASDLPLRNAIEFTSAEQSEEVLRSMGIEQPVRQLGTGEFRYRLAGHDTAGAELFSDRFSISVSLHLEAPAGMIAMLFPRTASGHFMASGNQVGDQKLIILPYGSGTDIVGPDLVGSEAILVPLRRFHELSDALRPAPQPMRPKTMVTIAGNTAKLHALRRRVRELVAGSAQDPSNEYVANLVAATIEWIGRYSPGYKPEQLRGNVAPARVARRAREHLEEHYREAVQLEDLCRVTGVSGRTLQRCFRYYFDLTITDYLKTVRLDEARRELLTMHPSLTSVTTVAMDHGNTHLGRFSVHYRERYGESPKETLANRAG